MKRIFLTILVLFLALYGVAFAQTTTTTTTTPTDIISEIVSTIKPSEGIMYGVREHQVKETQSES